MNRNVDDSRFTGAISEIYERHLVPLIFEPYAAPLSLQLVSGTVRARPLRRVLETAAGTGVLTRALGARRRAAVSIAATDLKHAMLDQAAAAGTSRPVEWRQADARALPFGFTAWDCIEENDFADVVTNAVASIFPDDPPQFLRRTPPGYFDRHAVARDLSAGGLSGAVEITTLEARSRATSPVVPAIAVC